MVTVTIWHNTEAEDGRYVGMLDGYQVHHILTAVYRWETDVDTRSEDFLPDVFRLFNVGHDPDFGRPDIRAVEYRRNKNRSLSVGDVVQVGDQWFGLDKGGWFDLQASPAPKYLEGSTCYGSTRIEVGQGER